MTHDPDDIGVSPDFITHADAVLAHESMYGLREGVRDPLINPQPENKLCPEHSTLGETTRMFAAVKGENHRKNGVLAIGRAELSITIPDSPDITWAFKVSRVGDQRVLEITLPRANSQQKNRIQNLVDIQFGTGMVMVV